MDIRSFLIALKWLIIGSVGFTLFVWGIIVTKGILAVVLFLTSMFALLYIAAKEGKIR